MKLIYAYLDPRKPGIYTNSYCTFLFEPIYVGIGNEQRPYWHLYEAESNYWNNIKVNKIRKIQRETGSDPYIIILNHLPIDEAIELEKSLIKEIGRIDLNTGTLTNLTSGGDGTANLSSEALLARGKKISESLKGVTKGRSQSEEWISHRFEGIEKFHSNFQNEIQHLVGSIKIDIKDIPEAEEFKFTPVQVEPDQNLGSQQGVNNPMYGQDMSGSKNFNAKYYYILISPEEKQFFVNLGCLKSVCKELGISSWSMSNAAHHYETTGKLKRCLFGNNRGWTAVKFKSLSDNPFICNNGQSASKTNE